MHTQVLSDLTSQGLEPADPTATVNPANPGGSPAVASPVSASPQSPVSPSSPAAPPQPTVPSWQAITDKGTPVYTPTKGNPTKKGAEKALAAQVPPGETLNPESIRAPGQKPYVPPSTSPGRVWQAVTDQGAVVQVPITDVKTKKAAEKALSALVPPGQTLDPSSILAPGQRAPQPSSTPPVKTWDILTDKNTLLQVPITEVTTKRAALKVLAALAPPGETIQLGTLRLPGKKPPSPGKTPPPVADSVQVGSPPKQMVPPPTGVERSQASPPPPEESKQIGAAKIPKNRGLETFGIYDNENLSRSPESRHAENSLLAGERPSGETRLSEWLEMDELPRDAFYETLVKASLLADLVHDRDDLEKVQVTDKVKVDEDGGPSNGNYWRRNPKAHDSRAKVAVSRDVLHPILTMLHELGHHIQHRLGEKAVGRVIDVVNKTTYRECIREFSDVDGPGYFLKDGEIFARAYAQWVVTEIAERNIDGEGLEELNRMRKDADEWFQFWKDAEFAGVREALQAELKKAAFKLHK